jgi:hypothetical protein
MEETQEVTWEQFKRDYATEHIIKENKSDPRIITEVAPWDNPHYFSILSRICPHMQSYRVIDADFDNGFVRTMWEEYVRNISEECPPPTKAKFNEMLEKNKFHRVADWYFNTDDYPSDLVFLNNSLHWSFPSLNLSKSLRDVKPNGLIIIKGHQTYNDHTIDLLKNMKEKLNFDIGVYLMGRHRYNEAKREYEYAFEEVDTQKDLVEWNKEMKRWLDRTSKNFFIALQNKGDRVPEKDCVNIMYESMVSDLQGEHVAWTDSIRASFKEFIQRRLPSLLEKHGLNKEHAELQKLVNGENPYCI